jgi:hypothetical protein
MRGEINGEPYPIAEEAGNLLWKTVQVAEEKDEVWDDLASLPPLPRNEQHVPDYQLRLLL